MKMILNGMKDISLDKEYVFKAKQSMNLLRNADEQERYFLISDTGISAARNFNIFSWGVIERKIWRAFVHIFFANWFLKVKLQILNFFCKCLFFGCHIFDQNWRLEFWVWDWNYFKDGVSVRKTQRAFGFKIFLSVIVPIISFNFAFA